MAEKGIKIIAQNKKAFHDYFIIEKYEAGIELFGTEVKSLRNGQVNLKDSFCKVYNGELYALGVHISPYAKNTRKLLCNITITLFCIGLETFMRHLKIVPKSYLIG